MSQQTASFKHRTVISTEHPLTITVNVPTPKPTVPTPQPSQPLTSVQRTVIHKTSDPAPSPLSPRKVKWSKIKSIDDAQMYIVNRDQVPHDNMKKLFSKNYLSATNIGLTDIYKIGTFLWVKLEHCYKKLITKIFHKKQLVNKIASWRTELDKYETHQIALTTIQKNLDHKFSKNNAQILSEFITMIKTTETKTTQSNIENNTASKKEKKKAKKKKKVKSSEADTDMDMQWTELNSNKDCKKRMLQEMDGFVDYGINQPPMKKQKLNGTQNSMDDQCFNCDKKLPENDKYRCSACKSAWYCGEKCQNEHWNTHEMKCNATHNNKDIKIERKSVYNWNWYEIIYWFNRVKYGRFNSMEYINIRKHLFIGRIKGFQLESINDITLNMIGIHDYNKHQMILNALAELLMEDVHDNNIRYNDALNMFNTDDIEIPLKYLDPISYELMSDVVMVKKIGTCYERKCIEKYVRQYSMDPFTQETVKLKGIVANDTLKSEIDNWKKKHLRHIKKDDKLK